MSFIIFYVALTKVVAILVRRNQCIRCNMYSGEVGHDSNPWCLNFKVDVMPL